MKNRKIKTLRISFEALIELFKTNSEHDFIVNRGFPDDAKIINVQTDFPHSNSFIIAVESETFEPCVEGTMPEMLDAIITSRTRE